MLFRSRLGTIALWVGWLSLLGPLKLAGLMAASALVLPGALALDGLRRQRAETPVRLQPAPAAATLPWELPRGELAERFCLTEMALFQARHARVCTVVIDGQGRIEELRLPAAATSEPVLPVLSQAIPSPSPVSPGPSPTTRSSFIATAGPSPESSRSMAA